MGLLHAREREGGLTQAQPPWVVARQIQTTTMALRASPGADPARAMGDAVSGVATGYAALARS